MSATSVETPARLACAIISTDSDFREALGSMLAGAGQSSVTLELEQPFTSITDDHLDRLRRANPDVVFVDLESDPHVAVKFVQFLLDSQIARAVVGAGSTDSADLLLQIMQAGVQDFVPKPIDEEKFLSLMARLHRRTGRAVTNRSGTGHGRLLSVFSPKGGAGATTLAVNLAVAIHQLTRKRTLVVDLDLELGETSLLLGIEPRFSSFDLVRNYHRVDEGLLASYIERDESGVDLLSAPYEPGDFNSADGDRMEKILRFLQGQYDYVVVDAPKALNPAVLGALRASDQLLLVCTPDLQSLRNANRALPLLREGVNGGAEDWIVPVINRHDAAVPIPDSEVERTLGMKVRWKLQNDYRPLVASINEGQPLVLGGKSAWADGVRAMAADITGVQTGRKKRRLLGGLVTALGGGGKGRTRGSDRGRG